ncbi:MAG: hypothetical protein KC587_17705 [Nitrospira sp.]|nr:hypothetical protein [Nitrospira sp.]
MKSGRPESDFHRLSFKFEARQQLTAINVFLRVAVAESLAGSAVGFVGDVWKSRHRAARQWIKEAVLADDAEEGASSRSR